MENGIKCVLCAILAEHNPVGQTILHRVAETNNATLINFFAKRGVSINEATSGGWTPLHNAVWQCKLEAAEELVKLGADVNAVTARGWSPKDMYSTRCRSTKSFDRMETLFSEKKD